MLDGPLLRVRQLERDDLAQVFAESFERNPERDALGLAAVGAAGGPTIISQTVVNIINLLEYKMPLEKALASPRIHHQWKPDELRMEALPETVRDALSSRGHHVQTVRGAGAAQIVMQREGQFEAAHDPRLKGKAAVW